MRVLQRVSEGRHPHAAVYDLMFYLSGFEVPMYVPQRRPGICSLAVCTVAMRASPRCE